MNQPFWVNYFQRSGNMHTQFIYIVHGAKLRIHPADIQQTVLVEYCSLTHLLLICDWQILTKNLDSLYCPRRMREVARINPVNLITDCGFFSKSKFLILKSCTKIVLHKKYSEEQQKIKEINQFNNYIGRTQKEGQRNLYRGRFAPYHHYYLSNLLIQRSVSQKNLSFFRENFSEPIKHEPDKKYDEVTIAKSF